MLTQFRIYYFLQFKNQKNIEIENNFSTKDSGNSRSGLLMKGQGFFISRDPTAILVFNDRHTMYLSISFSTLLMITFMAHSTSH